MRIFIFFAGFSLKGLECFLGAYASYCVTCFCSQGNGTGNDCMVREVTVFHLPFTQPSYCWGLCVTKGNCPTSEKPRFIRGKIISSRACIFPFEAPFCLLDALRDHKIFFDLVPLCKQSLPVPRTSSAVFLMLTSIYAIWIKRLIASLTISAG